MILTGATRVRQGWFGRLILQVEVIERLPDLNIRLAPGVDRMRDHRVWQDATVSDLSIIRYFDKVAEAKRLGEAPQPPPDVNASGLAVA